MSKALQQLRRYARRRAVRESLRSLWSEERGSAIAFFVLFFLGVLGMLALAIDLGMLYEARSQAQRTADAAALSGASALVDFGNDPGVETIVYQYALTYVQANPVRGTLASLEPADVVVNLNAWHVTVTVHRSAARGNPVQTMFGQIVGKSEVDVGAVATAQAALAGGVNCLLPLAMPDRWYDANDDGYFDPDDLDYYSAWPEPPVATGYSDDDIGTYMLIKPFKTGDKMNESWYYPWRPPGQMGGADYRDNIAQCNDPSQIFGFGETVDTEPGAMLGPTKQGFGDLIAQDPDAMWDSYMGCVTHNDGICDRSSARIRAMPMFDPTIPIDPGVKPMKFTNYASVFVDQLKGNEVWVYFLGLAGGYEAPGSGATTGPAVRFVRLVR